MATSSRPAFDYTLTSLRNGEQCVEIPLVCHQLIKVTAFLHCAVLYSQDTIIPTQQCLLQHMCNDYAVIPVRSRISSETYGRSGHPEHRSSH